MCLLQCIVTGITGCANPVIGSWTIIPSCSARNLGVILDDQLTLKDHIAKTARSCRFELHKRKIRPFLTEHVAQLLVQALVISRLDYCNALLARLPTCAVRPLQMIQNASAVAQESPCHTATHLSALISSHSSHQVQIAGAVLQNSHGLHTPRTLPLVYIPSGSLRWLVVPSQRGTKSLSKTFSFTVPCWWNDLPHSIRTAKSLIIFKKQLKTHLFHEHQNASLKK